MPRKVLTVALVVLVQLTGWSALRADLGAQKASVVEFLDSLQDSEISELVPIWEGGDLSTTYSNAMAAIAFIAQGETARAAAILDVFAQQPEPCPACTCWGGFQQFRDLETGAPLATAGRNDFWIGDNAWLLIAARRYEEATGDTQFADSLIQRLLEWFVCLEGNSPDPGIYSGYEKDGTPMDFKHPEGNIDVHGALRGLPDSYVTAVRDSVRAWIDQEVWPPASSCFDIGPANGSNLPLDNVSWGFLSLGPTHECILDHANARLRRTQDPYLIEVFDRDLTNRWSTDQSDASVAVALTRERFGADHVLKVTYSLDPSRWFRVFRSRDVDLAVTSGFRYYFWMRGNAGGNYLEIKLQNESGKVFIHYLQVNFTDWRLIEVRHDEFGIFGNDIPPGEPLNKIRLIEFALNNGTAATVNDTLLFGPIWYFDSGSPHLFPSDGFAAFESEQNHLWVEGTAQMTAAACVADRLGDWAHDQAEMARLLTPPATLPGLGLPNFLTGSTNQPIPESVASSWHLLASGCLDPFADRAGDGDGDGIGNPIDLCLGDDGGGDGDGDGVCAGLDCDDADPTAQSGPDCATPPPGFVRRVGDHLERDAQPFTLRGANYYPKDYAWKFWQSYDLPAVSDQIDRELDQAVKLGINTLRIFVPLSLFDGSDPNAVAHLEDFLARLAGHGLLAVITLFDRSLPYAAQLDAVSRAHVAEVVTPLVLNPVVLAYDVKNEIDCDYDAAGANVAKKWLIEMIAEIRSLDPYHLVTVGFLGVRTGETYCSRPPVTGPPVFDPALVAELAPLLDFVSFHYFLPEYTYEGDLAQLRDEVKAAGDKPVVLEELGLYTLSAPTNPCVEGAEVPGCIWPHGEADQKAYYSTLLALSGASGLTGSMFWTLTDFSWDDADPPFPGFPESEHCFGVLRNSLVGICETAVSSDYSPKPAAHVIRLHYGGGEVRYLDLFEGFVVPQRDEPPAGWREVGGAVARGYDPLQPTRLHWSRQPSRAAFSKSVPGDMTSGRVLSPVLRQVDLDRFPFLVARLASYGLQDVATGNPATLEIRVRQPGGADGPLLFSAGPDDSFPIDVRIDLRGPPAHLSGTLDLEIVVDLVPVVSDGFSATYELDCVGVIGSPSVSPCAAEHRIFADGFESGDTAAWSP